MLAKNIENNENEITSLIDLNKYFDKEKLKQLKKLTSDFDIKKFTDVKFNESSQILSYVFNGKNFSVSIKEFLNSYLAEYYYFISKITDFSYDEATGKMHYRVLFNEGEHCEVVSLNKIVMNMGLSISEKSDLWRYEQMLKQNERIAEENNKILKKQKQPGEE